jgi:Leucine-rich repeat (LRR) protein
VDNPSHALPRRFWPRLSIRGLMILVLVVGGGIGWVAQRAKIQRDAVRGISTAGSVRYNWQYVSEKYDPKASPPGSKWLRDIVGPDLLDTVVLVGLRGQDADDRVMSHVGALPGVETFNLQGKTSPSLTAAGMARIGQLPRLQKIGVKGMTDSSGFLPYLFDKPRLRSIWLQAAAVTDGDLARLARLTRLEELLLKGTNVTDAGFAHLANLKSLRRLELGGCHVGDLSALSGLKDLEWFSLRSLGPRHDQSTPVDLGPLRNLSKLSTLQLFSPNTVDDAGLAQIKDLPQLHDLDVAGDGVTEVGLAHIASMPRISSIGLRYTSIRDLGTLTPLMSRLLACGFDGSPIADDGVWPLAGASALKGLSLRQTKLTDVGLKHLAGLNGLTYFDLSATRVSDAGIKELAGLSGLQILDLRGTAVSEAGAASLQTRLPGLRILR